MPAHAPTIPTASAQGANKAFLSALQILDRSYTPELIQKYGAEQYTFMLDMIGNKVKTENGSFYHYEKQKRHQAVQVASITGGGSAGVAAVVTLAAGSHFDSGTKSPIRVGEVVMWSDNGRLGKITAINTSVAGAHTATVAPLKSTEQFNPGANDWLMFQGLQHVGEASDVFAALQPRVDKVTGTVSEIREDYEITDKAAMEKIEWQDPTSGQFYYRYFGTNEADKRFLNNRELQLMFSVGVTNTAITANGTVGTLGVIEQIKAGGNTLTYTPGSMDGIVDAQKITRELEFNGANPEIHALLDTYQYQEFQRELFGQYPNGSILWASAGGSAEVAAKLGFSSYSIDGFTFHFKKYAGFSPEKMFGVVPTDWAYRNYGLFIPQGFNTDPSSGQSLPTIALRYQEIPGIGELNAYEWGGLASTNKTGVQKLYNTIVGHYGVQVQAANQCVILSA